MIDYLARDVPALAKAKAAERLLGKHLAPIALTSSPALSLVLVKLGAFPSLGLTPTGWTETWCLRGHQSPRSVTATSPLIISSPGQPSLPATICPSLSSLNR